VWQRGGWQGTYRHDGRVALVRNQRRLEAIARVDVGVHVLDAVPPRTSMVSAHPRSWSTRSMQWGKGGGTHVWEKLFLVDLCRLDTAIRAAS
jgi:hypothetical protein